LPPLLPPFCACITLHSNSVNSVAGLRKLLRSLNYVHRKTVSMRILAACLAAGNVAAAVAQALGTSRGSEKDDAAITKIFDHEGAAWLKGDADALPPIFSRMSRSRLPQACSPWASSRSVYRYALS
jgi:hypothetical protein